MKNLARIEALANELESREIEGVVTFHLHHLRTALRGES